MLFFILTKDKQKQIDGKTIQSCLRVSLPILYFLLRKIILLNQNKLYTRLFNCSEKDNVFTKSIYIL